MNYKLRELLPDTVAFEDTEKGIIIQFESETSLQKYLAAC